MKSYKGYAPTIWMDEDDRLFHGLVANLADTIHFSGASVDELEAAFHGSVDAYLAFCDETGRSAERPYSGRRAFRTTPEHHRLIADAAARRAISLNQWMDEVLADAAHRTLSESSRSLRSR